MEERKSLYRRAKRFLFGAPRDIFDPKAFQRLTDRFLHNQTAFLAQKRLVFDGLPMIVMPIRAI